MKNRSYIRYSAFLMLLFLSLSHIYPQAADQKMGVTETNGQVTEGRYFWDGNEGQSLPLTGNFPANDIQINQTVVAPASEGLNRLSVQFKNNNGVWGPVQERMILVREPAAEQETEKVLTACEYYWSNNPAEKILLTGDLGEAALSLSQQIEVPAQPGKHTLYVRFRDSAGHWGPYNGVTLKINAVAAAPVIIEGEYFFDSDPGQGRAVRVTEGDFGSANATFTREIELEPLSLPVGVHTISARLKNNRGEWSEIKSADLEIVVKPMIELSATALNFSTVFIGDSSNKTIKIRNLGDADLNITNISLFDGYTSSWSQTQNPIAAKDSVEITFTFKPTEEKEYNGNFTITNNDVTKTIQVTGQGSGVPFSELSIIPPSPYNFGVVDIFSDISKSVSVSITNSGTAKLWISDVESSVPLVFSHNFGGLEDSIDVNESIQFDIIFTPKDTLDYSGNIRIINNSLTPEFLYHVTGQGAGEFAPVIVLDRNQINFGTVQTEYTIQKIVQITNQGTVDLEISAVNSSGNAFSMPLTSANRTIAAGMTKEFQVQFNPAEARIYLDSLAIFSNDTPHSPKYLRVQGVGSSEPVADIEVSDAAIHFGNIPIGENPVHRNLTIHNYGSADLSVTNISTEPNVFTSNFTSTIEIAPNNSRDIELSFQPTESRRYEGQMTIRNNDPDTPDVFVTLTGSSVFPELFLHTSHLDFGEVVVNASKDLILPIENTGSDTLKITSFTKTAILEDVCTIIPVGFDILPGIVKNFKVTFSPTIPVEYSGVIWIESNSGPDSVSVTGKGIDRTAPSIVYNQTTIENSGIIENTAIPIAATITDDNQVLWSYLFYRQGGKTSYDSLKMTLAGEQFQATIPNAYVTRRGVEYYLKAFDGANVQVYPATAPGVPAIVRVKSPSLPPVTIPEKQYSMLSIPSDLSVKNITSILEPILGSYQKTKWRLFRWINGAYVELPDNANFAFDPAKAFWLITATQQVITIDTCVSVVTNAEYQMNLDQGWNQVGTPYYFPVDWQDVFQASPNVVQGTVAWEYEQESGWVPASRLEPFKGYFIFTPYGGNILQIPPIEAGQLLGKPSIESDVFGENEWCIKISAKADELSDDYNFIGVKSVSEIGWDMSDVPEPPDPSDRCVQLFLDHPDWEIPGRYSADYQPLAEDGHFWDFKVAGPPNVKDILLNFEIVNKIPEHFEIHIIDNSLQRRSVLDLYKPLEVKGGTDSGSEFRILVGTREFIDQNDLGVGVSPQDFALYQNYPNPFNPVTSIQYSLPFASHVSLKVCDLLGREVATLVEREQMPGNYEIEFNGSGFASGVYFYQFSAGGFTSVKKFLLLK